MNHWRTMQILCFVEKTEMFFVQDLTAPEGRCAPPHAPGARTHRSVHGHAPRRRPPRAPTAPCADTLRSTPTAYRRVTRPSQATTRRAAAQGKVKVAINGFGRIGRNFLRCWHGRAETDMEVIAVNDSGGVKQASHLLKVRRGAQHRARERALHAPRGALRARPQGRAARGARAAPPRRAPPRHAPPM